MPVIFRNSGGYYQNAQSSFLFPPSTVTINSVTAGSTGTGLIAGVVASDVSNGTAVTNGITYNVYSFQPGTGRLPAASSSSQATYTVNYSCAGATTVYVLAVGGGGGGCSGGGGGGGGGGVVMTPVNIPSGTGSMNIAVGAGGSGNTASNNITGTASGGNTTVTVNANSTFLSQFIAVGGGNGGGSTGGSTPALSGGSGGSGGGGGNNGASGNGAAGGNGSNGLNYSNSGITGGGSYWGGGGGAGTVGYNTNGGNGIQCFLPGIATFAPSGNPYSSYYWGGGGGGSSSVASPVAGNGGLGGGGGGSNYSSSSAGLGGGSSINLGGSGLINDSFPSTKVAGGGGINTGGGGGGAWNGFGGAGGSGIVVIAFPSSAVVSSNQSAVLPSSIVSSNLYNAALNNATLTTAAYNSMKGAFACRLVNYNYFGPIVTLRHSLDTAGSRTQNFYSDICGNMGTGYLGTGLSVSNWLQSNGANTTYAFVTKWYNQGMDVSFNCATQYTTSSQPIYDVSNGIINFGYQGALGGVAAINIGAFLNLPDGAYPYLDSSYTYTLCHWNLTSGSNFFSITNGGTRANSQLCGIGLDNAGKYCQNWYSNDFNGAAGKYAFTGAKSTVTFKYTTGAAANSRINYVNYAATTYSESNTPSAVRAQTNINNYIGKSTQWADFNGQLVYLYVFSSALTDADRNLVEATPYQFAPLPLMSITVSSVTSTTFVPSWTAVANATTYVMYINGAAYGAVTSGQIITPGYNAPWAITVNAYNASYNLLASGNTTLSYFPTTNLYFDFYAGAGTNSTTNGATLTSWTDLRMGVTATGSTSATFNTNVQNGLPMISRGILTTPTFGSSNMSNWTHFSVFKLGPILSADGGLAMFQNPATNGVQIGWPGQPYNGTGTNYYSSCYNLTAWAPVNSSQSFAANGVYIAVISYSYAAAGTENYIYRTNGVDTTNGGTGVSGKVTSSGRIYVNGTYIVTPGSFSFADPGVNNLVGEQIFFNATLPLSTIQSIEQYLAYKWNIPIGATPAVPTWSPFVN